MRPLLALPLLAAACSCSAMLPRLDRQSEPLAESCVRVDDGYGPDEAAAAAPPLPTWSSG